MKQLPKTVALLFDGQPHDFSVTVQVVGQDLVMREVELGRVHQSLRETHTPGAHAQVFELETSEGALERRELFEELGLFETIGAALDAWMAERSM